MAKDKGRKEVKKPKKVKIKPEGFTLIEVVLILVALGIIGSAGWFVYDSKQNSDNAYNKAASLKTAAKNSAKSAAKKESAAAAAPAKTIISDSLKENTAAAIETQNTAALEGYMASSVTVVLAASEKGGAETAAQAVKDLDYLNSGTSPWDFNLSAATLTSYKNGFYKQYFGDNTIVGKSANDYVVSFGVNSAGKIDTVFMAADASSLTE